MVDVDDKRIADGMRRATDVVGGRMKIGRATMADMQGLLSNLGVSTQLQAFSDRDVVIEAVTENEELKTACTGSLPRSSRKTSSWRPTRRPFRSRGWRRPGPTRAVSSACTSSCRSTGCSCRGDPRQGDQRRDGRHDRGACQADQEDADRRQRLCRLPGQPHPVAVHDRERWPCCWRGRRWTRSTGWR